MIKENLTSNAPTTIQKPMGKVGSTALLSVALVVCFLIPVNAGTTPINWLPIMRPQTTTNQAVATTCSQSSAKQIIYSGDARASIPVSLGTATWSAAFQMVAMMLGNLNANVKAEMNCEQIG